YGKLAARSDRFRYPLRVSGARPPLILDLMRCSVCRPVCIPYFRKFDFEELRIMSLPFSKLIPERSCAGSRRLLPLLFVFALSFMLCAGAFAQSTTEGAIGGTVYDANGAVVANAAVVVHNNGTNAEQRVASDASGYYRVRQLQPATY